MNIYNNTKETNFIKKGFSGRSAIWHTGNCIAASMEHKQFLPTGATQDEFNPSYYSIRNPTTAQIMEFIKNIAE